VYVLRERGSIKPQKEKEEKEEEEEK